MVMVMPRSQVIPLWLWQERPAPCGRGALDRFISSDIPKVQRSIEAAAECREGLVEGRVHGPDLAAEARKGPMEVPTARARGIVRTGGPQPLKFDE